MTAATEVFEPIYHDVKHPGTFRLYKKALEGPVNLFIVTLVGEEGPMFRAVVPIPGQRDPLVIETEEAIFPTIVPTTAATETLARRHALVVKVVKDVEKPVVYMASLDAPKKHRVVRSVESVSLSSVAYVYVNDRTRLTPETYRTFGPGKGSHVVLRGEWDPSSESLSDEGWEERRIIGSTRGHQGKQGWLTNGGYTFFHETLDVRFASTLDRPSMVWFQEKEYARRKSFARGIWVSTEPIFVVLRRWRGARPLFDHEFSAFIVASSEFEQNRLDAWLSAPPDEVYVRSLFVEGKPAETPMRLRREKASALVPDDALPPVSLDRPVFMEPLEDVPRRVKPSEGDFGERANAAIDEYGRTEDADALYAAYRALFDRREELDRAIGKTPRGLVEGSWLPRARKERDEVDAGLVVLNEFVETEFWDLEPEDLVAEFSRTKEAAKINLASIAWTNVYNVYGLDEEEMDVDILTSTDRTLGKRSFEKMQYVYDHVPPSETFVLGEGKATNGGEDEDEDEDEGSAVERFGAELSRMLEEASSDDAEAYAIFSESHPHVVRAFEAFHRTFHPGGRHPRNRMVDLPHSPWDVAAWSVVRTVNVPDLLSETPASTAAEFDEIRGLAIDHNEVAKRLKGDANWVQGIAFGSGGRLSKRAAEALGYFSEAVSKSSESDADFASVKASELSVRRGGTWNVFAVLVGKIVTLHDAELASRKYSEATVEEAYVGIEELPGEEEEEEEEEIETARAPDPPAAFQLTDAEKALAKVFTNGDLKNLSTDFGKIMNGVGGGVPIGALYTLLVKGDALVEEEQIENVPPSPPGRVVGERKRASQWILEWFFSRAGWSDRWIALGIAKVAARAAFESWAENHPDAVSAFWANPKHASAVRLVLNAHDLVDALEPSHVDSADAAEWASKKAGEVEEIVTEEYFKRMAEADDGVAFRQEAISMIRATSSLGEFASQMREIAEGKIAKMSEGGELISSVPRLDVDFARRTRDTETGALFRAVLKDTAEQSKRREPAERFSPRSRWARRMMDFGERANAAVGRAIVRSLEVAADF
jgi:hypothetical protein